MRRFLLLFLCFLGLSSVSAQLLTVDDLYKTYGNSDYIKGIAKMELVSQDEYDKQIKKRVKYLNTQNIGTRKKNGVLTLKCSSGDIKYKEILTEDETHAEYNYKGFIDFLDAYMIEYVYWETSGFMLIDRKTGEELDSFEEYPYISKDKSNIVVVRQDPYEMSANLAVFELKGNEIKPIVSDNFELWVPYFEKSMFWADNNSMYIPVIHINAYAANTDLKKACQYIKLSIIKL